MQYANYAEHGIANNARFNLGNSIDRDDSNYPFWLLRERLLSSGIELNTPDVNAGRAIAFELHMNVMQRERDGQAFVLLMETAQICPLNESQALLAQYDRIFTWRDDLIDDKRYFKINFPNKRHSMENRGWKDRDRLCCLIAGNKRPAQTSSLDLYEERVKTIRWFEQHAPGQFDLYGSGWEISPPHSGRIARLWHRIALGIARKTGYRAFPSFQGRVERKLETLGKYRFSVCYENVKDLPGYITEKIFDCFFAGCVPIYWGASNVSDYIPVDCFIDRRKFSNHEDLYRHLDQMSETSYQAHQLAIQNFLNSSAAQMFFAESFAEQLTNTIVSALSDSECMPKSL
ncbi:MAG: glycosyltransferase family 10 [Sideroxyarcus sp.]|nr:glycosyltransferase family 10 [Sideroxyarcus sp.]